MQVQSHWRVDDQAFSIMMDYFYGYLSEGKTKDQALRLAKLSYLDNASPSQTHPFSWGAFAVVGDFSPLNAPVRWYRQWWMYLLVGVMMSMALLIFIKRGSRFRKTH